MFLEVAYGQLTKYGGTLPCKQVLSSQAKGLLVFVSSSKHFFEVDWQVSH